MPPKKRANIRATRQSKAHEQPPASGEAGAVRPEEPTAGSSRTPPQTPPSPRQVNVEDVVMNEGTALVKAEPSGPVVHIGSAVPIQRHQAQTQRQAENREVRIPREDDTDINLVVFEGPYAAFLQNLKKGTKSFFPMTMVIKLQANLLRRMMDKQSKGPTQNTLARSASGAPRCNVYTIMRTRYVYGTDIVEENVLGITSRRDKANTDAMKHFFSAHPEYLCDPDKNGPDSVLSTDGYPRNRFGAPFMEVKNYRGRVAFEHFYEQYHKSPGRVMKFSAWGVNEVGCLGLLADWALEGTSLMSMVYVTGQTMLESEARAGGLL